MFKQQTKPATLHVFSIIDSTNAIQMSMRHYRCIALRFINIHQKGRFWAASLASDSSMANEDSSLQTFRIQVQRGRPGGSSTVQS